MDTTTTTEENYDNTGCEGAPVRRMEDGRPLLSTRPKGSVVAAFPVSNDYNENHQVEIWISSPTGDSSDSFIYHLPCLSASQAEEVASQWQIRWGL